MSQPTNNVQLTCASCGQPYLIQAAYQNSPHQCPLCGAMVGAQQMQPQMGQPQMGQPGMQSPMQPGYQNPSYPAAYGQQPATKSKKSNVVFIVRCVVGGVAAVVIIIALFIIMNRGYNITVDLGDTSEFGEGSGINAGIHDVQPGKTFKATFRVKPLNDEDLFYTLRNADAEGASITEGGVFSWSIPPDIEPGRYNFNFNLNDKNNPRTREVVKIAFNVM